MERGGGPGAAREDEGFERGEAGFVAVDLGFESGNLGPADGPQAARHGIGSGQFRADFEEFVLHPIEQPID